MRHKHPSPRTRIASKHTACPDCDLLLPLADPPSGYTSLCPRCGARLRYRPSHSVSKTLGLSITGLMLYLPSILLPLITLKNFGFSDSANIIESMANFYQNQYYFVSLMILLSALIFPLLLFLTIFIISLCLHFDRYPPFLTRLFRWHLHLREWAMVEVYLLGILITIIKMGDGSEVSYHSGIFCFAALVFMSSAIAMTVDRQLFWSLIENKSAAPQTDTNVVRLAQSTLTTAAGNGFSLCHLCHKLVPMNREGEPCPRCQTHLHSRKPNSYIRTWALLLTATILILPANLLPIMEVDFLGIPDKSTIIDGIRYFFEHGSYFIGLIIFTASVLVPIFKIMGLSILLLSNRPTSVSQLRKKTKMYRIIAFIGRWSMLDIFVIALLTVVADFGFFTSVYAAPAATYFCLVVVTTMFAAITFDPRIMWDKCSGCNTRSQGNETA